MAFTYKEYEKSFFDNLTTGIRTEVSGYNERGTGLCLFEAVHIYAGTISYNNTYKVSFNKNGTSSEWTSSLGDYKYGGVAIYF